MDTPGLEYHKGSLWWNTGSPGNVPVVSQRRIMIASVVTAIFMMVMGSVFGRAGQILGAISGVLNGIEFGERCPVIKRGIIRYKIKSNQEIKKEKELLKVRGFEDKWFPSLVSRDFNPFKWIWPS